MVNNFDKLENICKFEKGTYYKFAALIRKKDYKEDEKCILQNEKGEMFVRQWFIESKEDLEKYKQDMIDLCNACKCRLYMTLDKKSIKKTAKNLAVFIFCFLLVFTCCYKIIKTLK